MIYDAEHFFLYAYLACLSSCEQLRSFAYFSVGLFIFLLLNFKNSLYILDISPLSDKCFANTFSRSVASLFILLTVSFT